MGGTAVAIVRYEEPLESVRNAVALCKGLEGVPTSAKVFVKPNIVFWTKAVPFPKWGVITTSRVVEDMVMLLKEKGFNDITIGEGTVTRDPRDKESSAHAFETLGYRTLERRFGVRCLNVFERPFEEVDLGEDVKLRFNTDILNSDLVVDLPVLKTHNQTVVSLGIKNLKGVIDVNSRKKCHSADPERDLNFMVARLADKLPPVLALLDGIYTNERGPSFDGRMRRSNLLVASADLLSADMVGAKVLGYEPSEVPHLMHAARNHGRVFDLSDVEVLGLKIEDVASRHKHDFTYSESEDGIMPLPMARQGLKGLYYRKYDLSLCTYCSGLNGLILTSIRGAWKGAPWDDVEVLTGKTMRPTPGRKKTVLLGKCIYQANKENPDITEMIAVKSCPPKTGDIVKALHQAGIDVNPDLFERLNELPGLFLQKYEGREEFDERFFRIE
jgi:uncharacterized protein (DUF362 family)